MPVTSSEVEASVTFEKGTKFLSFLNSKPLNLPNFLLLQPLSFPPPSFPKFLLWAFQVNQSSQLHFSPLHTSFWLLTQDLLISSCSGDRKSLNLFLRQVLSLSVSQLCFFHHGSNDPFFFQCQISDF